MLAQSITPGLEHRRDDVDDELGARQVGRRQRQLQGRQLHEDEKVVAEDRLDGRRAQIGDLFGVVDGFVVLIAHRTNVAPGVRVKRGRGCSNGPRDQVC